MATAETATSRRVSGTGLHPRPDRSDQQSTTRKLTKDVQELSASSAWGSGDWNGDAVTCRSTSAGAVRLRSHTIEMRYSRKVADYTAENAKGTDAQECQVGAEEVDVADVSNEESKGLKRPGKYFF